MAFVISSRRDGPKVHLPVAIVIDRSASTRDIRELLNQYAQQLVRSMKAQLSFRGVVELLAILYSSDYENVVDFKPLELVEEDELNIPASQGFTETGRALLYTLARLDEKKIEWRQKGEKYYQPMLFLLTDGYPDAGINAPKNVEKMVRRTYDAAASQIRAKEKEDKIIFVAAGIQQKNGYHANMEKLQQLSIHPERIFCVTDAEGSLNSIEKFYKLIYESTTAMFSDTPIEAVIAQIWDS